MARQRTSRSGFKPELRGTLGTLIRTAVSQAGDLAREGRARLDDALAGRRRTEALAELGEIVLDLIRNGEIELDQIPEARTIVHKLERMDEGEGADDEVAYPRNRERFDRREADDGTVSAKVWKPPVAPAPKKKLGGISFGEGDGDDEEDLAEYMNPEDVPPKQH
ncbi:MAG TPA: hypothetical protein VGC41_21855 [Kofleriaceae bacterium]